jgi:hypothetical protein
MALSEARQKEIRRLTQGGGEDLTAAIARGEKSLAQFQEKIRKEILDFVQTNRKKEELHYFAVHCNWEGEHSLESIRNLIQNPAVDPGTLLALFWNAAPEDYYMDFESPEDTNSEFEAEVYRTMLEIERQWLKCDRASATISFDPKNHAQPAERRASFARQIPEVMYQPIGSKKG